MLIALRIYLSLGLLFSWPLLAQEPTVPAAQLQRITGALTAIDQSSHTVTVKEDKTGIVYKVELRDTKNLRKVDPATLDLKNATRITADDLMVGDRVQVFAVKADDNRNAIAARGVILMSARELQSVHQEQSAAWQHSTGGVVTQVDAGAGKLTISARTPQGPKPTTVDAQKADFTRYSPENPKAPVGSKLAEIQVGDQVRVIGDASEDGSTVTARKVYSSPMRMLLCTVSAVSADGKQITVKDLQSKQAVTVALNDDSAVRKLPPMMAMGLARRLNPAAAGAGAPNANAASGSAVPGGMPSAPGGGPAAAPSAGGLTAGPGGAGGGGFRPGGGMRNGDMSQMLERIPKISATDLKPGDAVMVAGTPIGNDKTRLLASNVIAGVEPIFQSASPRQMQSLGDWGLGAGAGGADGSSPQ